MRCLALLWLLASPSIAVAQNARTGEAAFGDWTSDAPGLRRKITVADLPAPKATESVDNGPHEVTRPAGAELHVPAGFRIEQFASGFRDPRALCTAPDGDVFVSESRANQTKVCHGNQQIEVFAEAGLNKPFGLAFYPPGDDPQFLYAANTDGVIRFPYRNGDLHARAPAEKLNARLASGLLRGGGHWTRSLAFSPDGKKCTSRSVRARIIQTTAPRKTELAFLSSIRTAAAKKSSRGEFAMRSGSLFGPARPTFG